MVPESATASLAPSAMPTKEGLDNLAIEARACAEINFVGTVLALACFVSTLLIDTDSSSPCFPPPPSRRRCTTSHQSQQRLPPHRVLSTVLQSQPLS